MPDLKTGVKSDMFWSEIGLGFGEQGDTPPPRIPRRNPRASSSKSSFIPNLKMIEMIILKGKTTTVRSNICALCLHQVCVVTHANHTTCNHNCLKIVLIPKLPFCFICLFLRPSKHTFFNKNCRLNLLYSYYASSWNKRRACLSVFSVLSFFPRLEE